MLLYVLANSSSLYDLSCELRLLEKQQIKRMNTRFGNTNAPTTQLPAVGTNAVSVVTDLKPQSDLSNLARWITSQARGIRL
jgi:hypothetical protein